MLPSIVRCCILIIICYISQSLFYTDCVCSIIFQTFIDICTFCLIHAIVCKVLWNRKPLNTVYIYRLSSKICTISHWCTIYLTCCLKRIIRQPVIFVIIKPVLLNCIHFSSKSISTCIYVCFILSCLAPKVHSNPAKQCFWSWFLVVTWIAVSISSCPWMSWILVKSPELAEHVSVIFRVFWISIISYQKFNHVSVII